MRALRAFLREDRANIATLFAMGFALSSLLAAIAVDSASLYYERRQVQAFVDLAAISAASDPPRAAEIAHAVLADARLLPPSGTAGLTVRTGRYDPSNPVIAARFTANASPANAVEVSLEREGALHFASGFSGPPTVSARGLATVTPEVSFSIGSRLASLDAGLLNALLSSYLGTSISLSLVDYQSLANARVDALRFADGLGQQLGVTAGSYDDLLAMRANSGAISSALANLATGTARTALSRLATSGRGHPVTVGKLLSLGALGQHRIGAAGTGGIGASLSVLEILTAAAALADGNRQVTLPLSVDVPGLARLTMSIGIGEPPQGGSWFAIGPTGTILRTSQARIRLRVEMLGGPILLGAGVRVPIWLDLAHSEAMVTAAICPSPAAPRGRATISVRPGALRVAIGEMSDPALSNFAVPPSTAPVRLIDVLLLRVSGAALVEAAQTTPIALDFSSAEIAAGLPKTARTQTLGSSLIGSLLGNLQITIDALGLGLSPTIITQAVRALLAPLGPALDVVLRNALGSLGIGIGEADIRVYGVRCTTPVLVG